MSELAETVTAGPVLLHSGTYALYQTPAGGLHVVFRRTASPHPETGEITGIDGAIDEHLPDLPPESMPLIEAFLADGLPPQLLGMLQALGNGGGRVAMARMAAQAVRTAMAEAGGTGDGDGTG